MGSIAWRGLRWFTDIRTPSGGRAQAVCACGGSRSTAASVGHARVPRRPATRKTVEVHVPWLSARPRSRGHRPHPPGRRRRAESPKRRVCTAAGARTGWGARALSTARGGPRDSGNCFWLREETEARGQSRSTFTAQQKRAPLTWQTHLQNAPYRVRQTPHNTTTETR